MTTAPITTRIIRRPAIRHPMPASHRLPMRRLGSLAWWMALGAILTEVALVSAAFAGHPLALSWKLQVIAVGIGAGAGIAVGWWRTRRRR
jgi:hypothetical protein